MPRLVSLFSLLSIVALSACRSTAPEIKRLSPQYESVQPPAQCRLISVLPGSPADRAGLVVGDQFVTINGKKPENGAAIADMVGQSPTDMTAEVLSVHGSSRTVKAKLNNNPPRLGTVCDLSGWRKAGMSAAGNESITYFEGPYAATFSGIFDKGLAFLRVRLSNHSTQPLPVSYDQFKAEDAQKQPLRVYSPPQVLCLLYGEKGPRLLDRFKAKKVAVDADTVPGSGSSTDPDIACAGLPVVGKMATASVDYVEANAKYIAEESFWSKRLEAGSTADGLIYVQEPTSLPFQVSITVSSQTFQATFGMPQASTENMKQDDLVKILEPAKKGTPMRVTLKKGRVFVGKFSSYDNVEEKAWYSDTASLFNTAGFPLRTIKSIELIDK